MDTTGFSQNIQRNLVQIINQLPEEIRVLIISDVAVGLFLTAEKSSLNKESIEACRIASAECEKLAECILKVKRGGRSPRYLHRTDGEAAPRL